MNIASYIDVLCFLAISKALPVCFLSPINPKEYVEDIAWKANAKKVLLELKEIIKTSNPSKAGFAVKSIREDRNEAH